MQKAIQQLNSCIKNNQTFALFSHENVDGDGIGSLLARGRFLEKQGKQVSYFIPGNVSAIFSFLPETKKIQNTFSYETYDMLFFLDFSKYNRIRSFSQDKEAYFNKQNIGIIDHHHDTPEKNVCCVQDITADSCTLLVWECIQALDATLIDATLATYTLLGLLTDTGNFLYDTDHTRVFRGATEMIAAGATKKKLTDNLFRAKSIQNVQFLQTFLSRMQESNAILRTWYTDEDLASYKIDTEEAQQSYHLIQTITGPSLYVFLHQKKTEYKISIRSRGELSCTKIANFLGGGGHICAAGATIPFGKIYTIHGKSYTITGKSFDEIIVLLEEIKNNFPTNDA